MQEQVNEFLRYLKDERGSSENTIAAYRNDLKQFVSFLGQVSPPDLTSWDGVDSQLVEAYGANLTSRSYASSTVARKVASVKSFFSYLLDSAQLARNPTAVLYAPKVEKRLPRILSVEEINRLLAEPARSNTPKSLRDRALLALLYASGMRVSELIHLRVEDVDMPQVQVSCVGRDGKTRRLPLTPPVIESLSSYINKGRDALLQGRAESTLFVNQRGRPLTRQGLWLITKSYAEAAGLGTDITPHTLRHSCAAHRLADGDDLQKVRELLGHANISTTQVYREVLHPAEGLAEADLL